MSKETNKLRTMDDGELKLKLDELRGELMDGELSFRGSSNKRGAPVGKFGAVGGGSGYTAGLRNIRRSIARILTELRQRELERGVGAHIRKTLESNGYGLLSRQIKTKAGLDIHTNQVGLVCGRMEDVERVNARGRFAEARWKLRR